MRYKYLILFNFFLSIEGYGADGLGRLFFTPEQRAELEAARARRDLRGPITQETDPVTQPATPRGPGAVTYNGIVRRSDGKSTVWINGKSITERNRLAAPHDVNVLGMSSDGTVSIAIPQASRRASLKVGQSLNVESGRIEESYLGRGTVAPVRDGLQTPTAPANTDKK